MCVCVKNSPSMGLRSMHAYGVLGIAKIRRSLSEENLLCEYYGDERNNVWKKQLQSNGWMTSANAVQSCLSCGAVEAVLKQSSLCSIPVSSSLFFSFFFLFSLFSFVWGLEEDKEIVTV
jgi:hypothetical protein